MASTDETTLKAGESPAFSLKLPEEPLQAFLARCGLEGDVLDRTLAMLNEQDVRTCQILFDSWTEVKGLLRAAPRALIQKMLPEALADQSDEATDLASIIKMTPKAWARRRSSVWKARDWRSVARDARAVDEFVRISTQTAWQMGSSVAQSVRIELDAEDDASVKLGASLASAAHMLRIDVVEWRPNGFAHHCLPIKELCQWFLSADRAGRRAQESDLPALTPRDLRMLELHKLERGYASQPLLMVRRGAILCAVAQLRISAIVLRDRTYLFSSSENVEHTKECLVRMERMRLAAAAPEALELEASGGDGIRAEFGFQALDALLVEVNAQLQVESQSLLAQMERDYAHAIDDGTPAAEKALGREVSTRMPRGLTSGCASGSLVSGHGGDGRDPQVLSDDDDFYDEAALQRKRRAVAILKASLQKWSACAEAVEAMMRDAIEKDAADAADALGYPGDESAIAEAEVLLESHLHDLGSTTAVLDRTELHVENARVAFDSRETAIRNSLLRYEIITSAVGVGLACGGVISGIFGMNVSPGFRVFEENADGSNFIQTCVLIVAVTLLVIFAFSFLLYRDILTKLVKSWCRLPTCCSVRLRRKGAGDGRSANSSAISYREMISLRQKLGRLPSGMRRFGSSMTVKARPRRSASAEATYVNRTAAPP